MMNRAHLQPKTAPRHAGPPAPRILVVDGDEGVRQMLARLLTGDGFAVTALPEGGQFVEIAPERPCELVLLDRVGLAFNGAAGPCQGWARPAFELIPLGPPPGTERVCEPMSLDRSTAMPASRRQPICECHEDAIVNRVVGVGRF